MIHAAFMGAVVIYGIVSFFVIRDLQTPVAANVGLLRVLIWLIALAEFSFAFASKDLMVKLLNCPAAQISSGSVELPKRLTTYIITCSLLEIPATLGLVLSILSHSFHDYYYLGFLSLIGLWMRFPKREMWTEAG